MKVSCLKCGKELEVKFGFTMKNCKGLGFEIYVECSGCGTQNKMSRILEEDEKKVDEVKRMLSKARKETGGYIG